ncbi:MAG: hypothetical protein GY943_29255 [Chloroflexi bacterium]|nr:hypothetical protein [Chloroflexota bacterium]
MLRFASRIMLIIFMLLIVGCSHSPDQLDGISFLTLEMDGTISELAWSPNGHSIAFSMDPGWELNTELERSIYTINLETNSYLPIKKYSDRIIAYGAEWSPDSKSLIMYYPSNTVGISPEEPVARLAPFDIVIVNASTGELLQSEWNGSYAAWGVNQDEVIVVDSDVGKPNQELPIYQVNLITGITKEIAKTIPASIFDTEGIDVSSAGLLAYRNIGTLSIVDIASGEQISELKVESRLYSPSWSPDGEILAYVQDKANPNESEWHGIIYLATVDGSCHGNPLDTGTIVKSIDWSPDGRQLAFSTTESGRIYFLDLTTGVGKELLDSYQMHCME